MYLQLGFSRKHFVTLLISCIFTSRCLYLDRILLVCSFRRVRQDLFGDMDNFTRSRQSHRDGSGLGIIQIVTTIELSDNTGTCTSPAEFNFGVSSFLCPHPDVLVQTVMSAWFLKHHQQVNFSLKFLAHFGLTKARVEISLIFHFQRIDYTWLGCRS